MQGMQGASVHNLTTDCAGFSGYTVLFVVAYPAITTNYIPMQKIKRITKWASIVAAVGMIAYAGTYIGSHYFPRIVTITEQVPVVVEFPQRSRRCNLATPGTLFEPV